MNIEEYKQKKACYEERISTFGTIKPRVEETQRNIINLSKELPLPHDYKVINHTPVNFENDHAFVQHKEELNMLLEKWSKNNPFIQISFIEKKDDYFKQVYNQFAYKLKKDAPIPFHKLQLNSDERIDYAKEFFVHEIVKSFSLGKKDFVVEFVNIMYTFVIVSRYRTWSEEPYVSVLYNNDDQKLIYDFLVLCPVTYNYDYHEKMPFNEVDHDRIMEDIRLLNNTVSFLDSFLTDFKKMFDLLQEIDGIISEFEKSKK